MTVWLHEHPREGEREFRLGRDGDVLVAEWVGIGTLRATTRGGEFTPVPNAPAEAVARTVCGTASAFMRHLRGELTLHASAAALPAHVSDRGARALAFVGASGAGKSTLAAYLCARAEGSLLADDLLHIDVRANEARVTPTARAHRLLADARRSLGLADEGARKVDVEAASRCDGPVPLGAIVCIAFDAAIDAPRLAPLRGMDAFRALSESLFRFVLDEPEVQRRDLDRLADVAAAAPVFELRRPRGLEHLAATSALLRDLAAGARNERHAR